MSAVDGGLIGERLLALPAGKKSIRLQTVHRVISSLERLFDTFCSSGKQSVEDAESDTEDSSPESDSVPGIGGLLQRFDELGDDYESFEAALESGALKEFEDLDSENEIDLPNSGDRFERLIGEANAALDKKQMRKACFLVGECAETLYRLFAKSNYTTEELTSLLDDIAT